MTLATELTETLGLILHTLRSQLATAGRLVERTQQITLYLAAPDMRWWRRYLANFWWGLGQGNEAYSRWQRLSTYNTLGVDLHHQRHYHHHKALVVLHPESLSLPRLHSLCVLTEGKIMGSGSAWFMSSWAPPPGPLPPTFSYHVAVDLEQSPGPALEVARDTRQWQARLTPFPCQRVKPPDLCHDAWHGQLHQWHLLLPCSNPHLRQPTATIYRPPLAVVLVEAL